MALRRGFAVVTVYPLYWGVENVDRFRFATLLEGRFEVDEKGYLPIDLRTPGSRPVEIVLTDDDWADLQDSSDNFVFSGIFATKAEAQREARARDKESSAEGCLIHEHTAVLTVSAVEHSVYVTDDEDLLRPNRGGRLNLLPRKARKKAWGTPPDPNVEPSRYTHGAAGFSLVWRLELQAFALERGRFMMLDPIESRDAVESNTWLGDELFHILRIVSAPTEAGLLAALKREARSIDAQMERDATEFDSEEVARENAAYAAQRLRDKRLFDSR